MYEEQSGVWPTQKMLALVSLKSAEGLAKMMAAIANVFEAAGLTVSEKKTDAARLRTPNQTPLNSPLVIVAAGPRSINRQSSFCTPGRPCQHDRRHYARQRSNDGSDSRGHVLRSLQAVELYNTETAPFTLNVRMLNTEVMETLIFGGVSDFRLSAWSTSLCSTARTARSSIGSLSSTIDNAPTTARRMPRT